MPTRKAGADPAPTPSQGSLDLARRYRLVRDRSVALVAPLSAEDQCAQSMPDASPAKWHLAHTSWFFETFVLAPHLDGYQRFDPRYGYIFNSYYETVGARHPRPARGLLTRPSADEVIAYRGYVDAAMGRLFAAGAAGLEGLIALGLAHEEQHQELLLMDILHLFAQSPIEPAYSRSPEGLGAAPEPMRFVDFAGGAVRIGHEGDSFSFDNEGPSHEVLLAPYQLADRLVTNGEWLDFIADDGYGRAELWLSDGWALVTGQAWGAPLYWDLRDGQWSEMTLLGRRPLDLNAPVAHISYFEAQAYAAWAGARLPTEFEWENAARGASAAGNFLDRGRLMTAASPGAGLRQMFGDVWEWTASAYAPYPGFRAEGGAIGEYNGKFMSGQRVLRGGACVTPEGHVRASYRNFFYPHQRWMFSGLRLAKDAPRGAAVEPADSFAHDVVAGLGASPKALPSKYFYDAEGSRLFEAICELPEYYPTRTETALLHQVAPLIAAELPRDAALIEYGSGASTKTRLLLDAAADRIVVYTPIDISQSALDEAAQALAQDYPGLTIAPMAADFTAALTPPQAVGERQRIGFFPGSTLGNFGPHEAVRFLQRARRLLGPSGQFIVGIDLVKDPAVLVAAYDDARGVTAAFNKNLLQRINRELDGDFDLGAFDHLARWNAAESRMEMHLVSTVDQTARAAGRSFRFATGERIHTENSYKFTLDGFSDLATAAGWRVAHSWTNPEPAFAIVLLD